MKDLKVSSDERGAHNSRSDRMEKTFFATLLKARLPVVALDEIQVEGAQDLARDRDKACGWPTDSLSEEFKPERKQKFS